MQIPLYMTALTSFKQLSESFVPKTLNHSSSLIA